MNTSALSSPSKYTLNNFSIKLRPTNPHCSQLELQVQQHKQKQTFLYCQTINAKDFGLCSVSILFLKLAIETGKAQIQKVQNLIWEKVVIGKDLVDAAMENVRKVGSKKYEGVVLVLDYPENIMIVLPLIKNQSEVKRIQIKQKQQETQAKRIFFSSYS